MNFGGTIQSFFNDLTPPEELPAGVEILWPYGNPEALRVMDAFYRKFMNDNQKRVNQKHGNKVYVDLGDIPDIRLGNGA